MKNWIIPYMLLSLAGCTPANNKSNGHYRYINTAGLEELSHMTSLTFETKDIGFIGGDCDTFSGSEAIKKNGVACWLTEDGGYHWKKIFFLENFLFMDMQYNPPHLYISCRQNDTLNVIYQSDDYGKTWREKCVLHEICYGFHFRDSLYGILETNDKRYKTRDGGKTLEEYMAGGGRIYQINDSVMYSFSRDLTHLLCWNYVKDCWDSRIPIPQKKAIYYKDRLLICENETEGLSMYELKPNHQWEFLHNFKRAQRVEFLARHKNKIYFCYTRSLKTYIRYSEDGGRTWQKRTREWGSLTQLPACIFGDDDTLRFWMSEPTPKPEQYFHFFRN